ncbi:MAG: creatininase family protein [Burkholderiales bacterium]
MLFQTTRLLLALAWAASAAPLAHAAESVFLEDLTSTELAAAVRAGKTTILVPIGGTEQNGPHMTLGKHNVRAKALAGRIAAALGDALVAPTIAYVPEGTVDPPTGHMRFPGTITIPSDAFRATLASAARSFRLAGFRTVVFLGDHGGYYMDTGRVAQELNREWAKSNVRVVVPAEYYRAATDDHARTLKQRGFTDAEIGTHAGLSDTSLAMAVDPRLVRTEQLQASPMPGVAGDPRRASAELGQVGIDDIVAQTAAAIRKATAHR